MGSLSFLGLSKVQQPSKHWTLVWCNCWSVAQMEKAVLKVLRVNYLSELKISLFLTAQQFLLSHWRLKAFLVCFYVFNSEFCQQLCCRSCMYSFLLLKLQIFCSFQFILDVPLHFIFCSFQVIPDVPLGIIFVHFRSFWMFHFALCLFISGHSRCSTLHYFCSFQVILDVPLCICVCVFISGYSRCSTLHYFCSFQIFHFALFLLISGRSGCSTLHVGHTRIQQTTQWMSSFWILCP